MNKKRVMFPASEKGAGKERVEEVLQHVVFVDPGLGGTGWAYYQWVNTGGGKVEAPTASGVIRAPRGECWENQAFSICHQFSGTLAAFGCVQDVVIEFPGLFGGDATSYAAAAKGDLFKLAVLVGGLGYVARGHTRNMPVYVSQQEWQGQLNKQEVLLRIEKRIGMKCRDHEADAVAMGLSAQGVL